MVRLPVCLLIASLLGVRAHHTPSHKYKRQIFREEVSPHSGGKIPEEAFRTDRLALNRLNKEGISVPDGVLLEQRHKESHYGEYRADPSIAASIVRLVQHPDGRYAPPEGHYPFNNLVESTYLIRQPWGHAKNLVIPPHKTVEVPLTIPHPTRSPIVFAPHHSPSSSGPAYGASLGPSLGVFKEGPSLGPFKGGPGLGPFKVGPGLSFTDEDIIHLSNQLDNLYPDDLTSTKIWSGGFGQIFHETPARFLRQASKKSHMHRAAPGKAQEHYPSLKHIPKTSFTCGSIKGKMVADLEANCQVFHLCHTTGEKESFLCPQGMRYEASRSQCSNWTKVSCAAAPR